jgi:hypothetical protein
MLTLGLAVSAAPAFADKTQDSSGSGSAAGYDQNDPGGGGSAAPNTGGEAPPPAESGGTEYGSTAGRTSSTAEYPVVDGLRAKLLPNGRAAAPSIAPPQVQQAIWAANELIGKPYVYGGGHNMQFKSRGYDCSGSANGGPDRPAATRSCCTPTPAIPSPSTSSTVPRTDAGSCSRPGRRCGPCTTPAAGSREPPAPPTWSAWPAGPG